MTSGSAFVLSARRRLIQIIALALVISGCTSFLLVSILMMSTGNIAGFAPYLGIIALGLGGSLATLALLERFVLWQAVIPLAVGIDGAVVSSVFLLPEQTLVALPFLLVPLVLICLGRHRPSTLVIVGGSIVVAAFLASLAPRSQVDRVVIGDALPLISGIGMVTLLVIIWLLSDRLLAISDQAVAMADNRAAEAEAARRQAEEAQRTIEQQYAEQKQLLDLVSVLETPVITIGEGVLLAPVVGRLDSRRAEQLTQRLLNAVHTHRANAVIIDIAGVPTVDTMVAQLLIRTAQSLRLLGSRVVLTGITAETAMTLSHLGVSLNEMSTVRDPQEALLVLGVRP
ncbi:STAS domain-containing protein [Roseiflexus castenholzii]|jgi:anti-anti-sigma regulatory factor|uniref:Anti-sigma-factor antagonist n=1 Tax=Roseiflexus castenholzii (strain DSM 13941 / HLO8) TaxID=383372 RepID=A7NML5_ROSCS|nr:STAS domain-containing protein [Roseiflexus castenholzii]ABU58786.1 anti-sigma-factor antagonist [Roseiflexus castenholzii DSM 13941]